MVFYSSAVALIIFNRNKVVAKEKRANQSD